jgi:hypothetical protein
MTEFKARANAVATPFDMWEIEDYLREQRREINKMFDYRYSQLPLVFAGLIRQGYLGERGGRESSALPPLRMGKNRADDLPLLFRQAGKPARFRLSDAEPLGVQ